MTKSINLDPELKAKELPQENELHWRKYFKFYTSNAFAESLKTVVLVLEKCLLVYENTAKGNNMNNIKFGGYTNWTGDLPWDTPARATEQTSSKQICHGVDYVLTKLKCFAKLLAFGKLKSCKNGCW